MCVFQKEKSTSGDLPSGNRLEPCVEMRRGEQEGTAAAAIWRARLKYATRRFVVDKKRNLDEAGRQRLFLEVVEPMANAIDTLGSAYRIALFNHL